MSNRREPVICPRCKRPMNRHAEKPVEPRSAAEVARAGVIVEEIHTCPGCGSIVARHEA